MQGFQGQPLASRVLLDPIYSIQIFFNSWKEWRARRRTLAEDLRLSHKCDKDLEQAEKNRNEAIDGRNKILSEIASQQLKLIGEKRIHAYKVLTGEAPLASGEVQLEIDRADPLYEVTYFIRESEERLKGCTSIGKEIDALTKKMSEDTEYYKKELGWPISEIKANIKELKKEKKNLRKRIKETRDDLYKQSGLNLQRGSVFFIAAGVFLTAAFNTLTYFNIKSPWADQQSSAAAAITTTIQEQSQPAAPVKQAQIGDERAMDIEKP